MTVDEANARVRECKRNADNQLNELMDLASSVGRTALNTAMEDESRARSAARGRKLAGFFIPFGISGFISFMLFATRHYFWWVVVTGALIFVSIKIYNAVAGGANREVERTHQVVQDVERRNQNFQNNLRGTTGNGNG